MNDVYMERCDHRLNMARFYAVSVQPSLFGDWMLVCHWGRIGTDGRVRQQWFSSLDEAQSALAQTIVLKRRRGYAGRNSAGALLGAGDQRVLIASHSL